MALLTDCHKNNLEDMTNKRFKAHLYKSLYGFYQLIAWQFTPGTRTV